MKRFLFIAAIFFSVSAGVSAQVVAPKPSPTPLDDGDVVKISTNLIQIDVSVTDLKGKVITDLRQDEIEIYENGEKQKITNFSFISSLGSRDEAPQVRPEKTDIPVPQVALRAENIRRTIAIVVDDLSLSFESAAYTRQALKKFVDNQMQDGDLVAIIRTGAGIGALQQFTSDKRILYAAIERVKWNPIGNGGISAFAPINQAEEALEAQSEIGGADDAGSTAANTADSFNDFQSSVFATGTLGALRYIVTGMSELPGRKSVILFSDGFKMFEQDEHGFSQGGRVLDFLKDLVEKANRASVVFYTVDARGLQFTGFTAADSVTNLSPTAMSEALSERRDQLLDTQAGLSYLAKETGGFSIQNNNDLSGGVRRVLDDQSYYLVAYDPESDTFDGKRKFNKLEVRVTRKGTKVRYRSGFFNVADKPSVRTPLPASPMAQLQNALTSPFAVNDINLKLNALFGNDERWGYFVRSLLHIDAQDLKFTDQPDGNKKAEFEVLAVNFGDNGQPLDQIAKRYILTVRPEKLAKLQAEGFVYQFTFPVKKPGAYQYRVAVRDEQAQSLGSASQFIEVPNLKKGKVTSSSLLLESYTPEQWKMLADPNGTGVQTNPQTDTALRRFSAGSILRYGYEVYNAKLNSVKMPSIKTKIRIFRDGKLILDGQYQDLDAGQQKDVKNLKLNGAISLGSNLPPGDYILQAVIIDSLAKTKQQIATQFVQFEVVP